MTCPNCHFEGEPQNFIILGLEPMYGSYWHKGDKVGGGGLIIDHVNTALYNLRACPSCKTVFVERKEDNGN